MKLIRNFFPAMGLLFCIFNCTAAAGYEVIITSSTNNLPGLSPKQIYSRPDIFGPWRGSNYVQQAIDALPYYSSSQPDRVSGGSICVLGNNYFPGPLLLTNYGRGYASFKIYSPVFCGGALISRTNPAILVADGSSGNEISPEYDNVIIASTLNQTNFLYLETQGVNNRTVNNCYFGLWLYLTNNTYQNPHGGLSTSTDLKQYFTNDLVVYFNGVGCDSATFSGNHFLGLAAVAEADDHFVWNNYNSLFAVGQNSNLTTTVFDTDQGSIAVRNSFTDWTTNSFWWTGGALVLLRGNGEFHNTHFYGSNAGYLDCRSVSSSAIGPGAQITSEGDAYESVNLTVIHTAGRTFMQRDPVGEVHNSATISFSGANLAGYPPFQAAPSNPSGVITDDGYWLGSRFTAQMQTGSQNLTNWSNLVTNSINSLSGVITNAGAVWYFLATNGTPAIPAPSGSLCTTTNGQLFIRSNNVWLLK